MKEESFECLNAFLLTKTSLLRSKLRLNSYILKLGGQNTCVLIRTIQRSSWIRFKSASLEYVCGDELSHSSLL